MTASAKDDTPTYVYGVNHKDYIHNQNIISNSDSTTNCLAPFAKLINEKFGIDEGMMTTIHSVTQSQTLVDGRPVDGKDWRDGRASSVNLIPTTTSASKDLELVCPELKGKLLSTAFRVPTLNVSVIDMTLKLSKGTDYKDLCAVVKEASEGELKGILGYTAKDVVS